MTVRTFFANAPRNLGSVLVAALPDDVRVGFVVRGSNGGTWTVETRGGGAHVFDGLVGPLDCIVRGSTDEFLALVSGDVDARRLFLSGRLEVEGDIGLVLQLQRAVASTGRPAPRRQLAR